MNFNEWNETETIVILLDKPEVTLPYYADLVAKENVVNISDKD